MKACVISEIAYLEAISSLIWDFKGEWTLLKRYTMVPLQFSTSHGRFRVSRTKGALSGRQRSWGREMAGSNNHQDVL